MTQAESNAGWTPGPWKSQGHQGDEDGIGVIALKDGSDNPSNGLVAWIGRDFGAAAGVPATAEANARLIAAAPDLAEALEATVAQLDKAADQFAFYADEHAKKGTKEGETKGAVNHQWALACAKAAGTARAALAKLEPGHD